MESTPLTFFCYISAGCYFFRAETSWLFSFKPCARFKTIFKKIGPRVMTRRCVIERWVQRKLTKNWFSMEITHKSCFFCFQDTLTLCFILFIWFIWSKNMCKHTLTHIIAKKCNFAWKNSENPWFWRFFVFLTWPHLWRHCGVIQGMFVLFFWYQWTREGHSYPLVPQHLIFRQSVSEILGGRIPPGCEMGPKSPALLGLK